MNLRTIVYWIATALTAFSYLLGGAFDVARPDFVVEEMTNLGYPSYFPMILGVWKILGGIVVLLPGTPRLKEWAYAGMTFNLTSAVVSHIVVGDPPGEIITPLIILAIVAVSWALRPTSRILVPASN